MAIVETLALVAILVVAFYKWATAKYGVLRDRGLPHEPPTPLIGNLGWDVLSTKTSFMKFMITQHMKNKDRKVYAFYSMREPVVVMRDVELIKKVGIKDFDYFTNHRATITTNDGTNFELSLIGLRDQKWKQMRNTLTPAFTGSKMRQMFELINEVCLAGVQYLEEETGAAEKRELELEMKEYFTRFTNDVIASAAFGLKVDSFKEKDNKFYSIGRAITQFKGWVMFKMFLFALMPKVMKFLRVNMFDPENVKYFNHLVLDAIKYREEHGVVRPDMIHLLMEAKKNLEKSKAAGSNEEVELGDKDLVAQCLLFFFAGFETVATCLCFTAHELLENPEVQQRLYEEIHEVQQQLGDRPLNYDALTQMKYMDQVLSESLRKWPPAIIADRVCSKDYTLTDDDGNVLARLKKDDNILVPIAGLHYDPDNFENPHQFNPERFSEENKDSIKPLTYLPFGVGPRNCIGNRLALMETKSIIFHMLLRFRIVAGEKTSRNLFEDLAGFQMKPRGDFWMKLVPRDAWSRPEREELEGDAF